MLSNLISSEPISTVSVGDQSLKIIRTRRKSSIALKAKPEGVAVLVPQHLSNRQLSRLLNKHQSWLQQSLKRLEQHRQNQPEPPIFTGQAGDVFEWLGASLRVAVHRLESNSPSKSSYALLNDQSCLVHIKECDKRGRDKPESDVVCHLIESHLKQVAHHYLEPKLTYYAEQIGVEFKSLTVKGYKSRWGSCYPDGRIQFNWRLLQAPSWVVDYVVVHELCHLIHPNHSNLFWDLVNQHYPQTPEAKSHIRLHGARWIQFLQ